jgi:hypothetical protein
METNRLFKIPAANLSTLQDKIEQLTKKAAKVARKGQLADTTPIGLEVVERAVEETAQRDALGLPLRKVFFLCRVTGMTPKLGGWMFVATLQHEAEGTILRTVPTASIPEGTLTPYRNAGPQCEHCQYNRRRNDTFVVRHDDGSVKQVGRNCLADFTGTVSPEALASLAEILAMAGEISEMYEGSGGGGGEIVEDTQAYLAFVACAIREHGWLSRTNARDGGGRATADRAWTGMHPTPLTRREDRLFPTDADVKLAADALSWTEAHFESVDQTSLNDYEHNLRVATMGGAVTSRLAGIIGSLIGYYDRAQGRILCAKLAEAGRAQSNAAGYVGTVGGKLDDVRVTLAAVYSYPTQYGVTNAHKFLTEQGAVIMWKTGSVKLDLGEYVLSAKVKAHDEYKGELQTVVTHASAVKFDPYAVLKTRKAVRKPRTRKEVTV